ncbi:hypothetical protein SAMN05518854_11778 [Variovorax sp. YR266]|uniref:hypothetical protein n=1 Tax=Variovorax sp. YR266 TaxID=1884386 RepID=UPI000894C10F|nr:hypothetical protein [Variovorax sp. YR266]SDZ71313.1 hypothetical protein SAMN05518854_11778 [Variovorax sp. YR266]
MANLNESDLYEAGIYQLEEDDPVLGGPTGIDNLAPRQLANRTRYQRLRNVTPWDASLPYPANVAYVSYGGSTWKSVGESTNVAPGSDAAKWVRWGYTAAELASALGDAVTVHEGKSDPHPQYAMDSDLTAHTGAANPHGQYVRHDAAQGLTTPQATQARANINAETAGTAVSEIQKNAARYAADTGAANAAAAAFAPAITALTDGMELWVQAAATNTGALTMAVNALAAKPVVGEANIALQGGEYLAGGLCHLSWSAALDKFILHGCNGAPLQVANGTKSQHTAAMGQLSGVVGTVRNGRMYLGAANASGTFTADELILASALGGLQYRLPGFNKTVNLGTVGAGGMDVGAPPATGFVALYAIYNPTSGASALLATNATAAVAPEVYGGANMPAGYTASALVSVWPVSSSQFTMGLQRDRALNITATVVLNTSAANQATTALSIASVVPMNAKSVSGWSTRQSSTATSGLFLMGDANGMGSQQIATGSTSGTGYVGGCFNFLLSTAQTIYWQVANSLSSQAYISGYTF